MGSQEGQQPSSFQKKSHLKLKQSFSVPVKKSDTLDFEMNSGQVPKTDTHSTENSQLDVMQVFQEKCTDFDFTAAKTVAKGQEFSKNSKKRKKSGIKADKKILTKKGKKEQESKGRPEKDGHRKNVNHRSKSKTKTSNPKCNRGKKSGKNKSIPFGNDSLNTISELSDDTESIISEEETDGNNVSRTTTRRWKIGNVQVFDSHESLPLVTHASRYGYLYIPKDIKSYLQTEGTWVQCSNTFCKKWRYLEDVEDPLTMPEIWDCTMNSDLKHNSCDAPEVSYEEGDHIYTNYTIGSVVWAKLDGYPWWPAMVDCDPDTDTYYEVLEQSEMVPYQFHVTFFDDNVTRSWVKVHWLAPYDGNQLQKTFIPKGSNAFKKEITAAMRNANAALKLSLKTRAEEFGFMKRFQSRSKARAKASTKKKLSKQDFVAKEVHSKASQDYIFGDIIEDTDDDDDFPIKAATKRKLKVKTGMKKPLGYSLFELPRELNDETNSQLFVYSSDQGKACITGKIKRKSEIKTVRIDTPKNDETSLPVKLSRNNSFVLIHDINFSNGGYDRKENCLTSSVDMIQKKMKKKKFKKEEHKSPSLDGYDQHDNMKNVKGAATGAKHINDDCINSDVLHVNNNDELKMNDHKQSKIETSSHKETVSDKINETSFPINDVSTHTQIGKNKEMKEHCEDVSEIRECLISTTNTHEEVKKTVKKSATKKSSGCRQNEKKLTLCEEVKKTVKKSVTKKSSGWHQNEKKQNLCDIGNDNSTNVRLNHLETIQSSKIKIMSKHVINDNPEEITSQTDGEFVAVNTFMKSENSCDHKNDVPNSSSEKIKYQGTGITESIFDMNGKNSAFKKEEFIMNQNGQSLVEDKDALDAIKNKSAESCAKKLSDDTKKESDKGIKRNCFTGPTKTIIGKKQMKEDSNKNMNSKKITKSKCMITVKKENAKKFNIYSPNEKATVNEIVNHSNRIAYTNNSDKNIEDVKIDDQIETDQQIVPDIETGTHNDSVICSDLTFSDITISNQMEKTPSHFDMIITIDDDRDEEERDLDWDIESRKSNDDNADKNVNFEDSCHEGTDDYILQLDIDNVKNEQIINEEANVGIDFFEF